MKHHPLIQALHLYSKLYHTSYSIEHLTDALPLQKIDQETLLHSFFGSLSLFERMAQRIGLHSKLVQKDFTTLLASHLPVIALLKKGTCCIITSIDTQKDSAVVIYPHLGTTKKTIGLQDLKAQYGQTFITLTPQEFSNASNYQTQQSSHWFKDTIILSKNLYKDAIIASFFINLFILAAPLFVMNVYDRVIPNNAIETLIMFSVGIIIVFILDLVLKLLRVYFLEVAAQKTDKIIATMIFEKSMGLKMEQAPSSIGAYTDKIKNFEYIRSFFASASIAVLIDFPFLLLFLLAIFAIGSYLVLIPLCVIAVILIFMFYIKYKIKNDIAQLHAIESKKNALLVASLYALETIKSQAMVASRQHKWERLLDLLASKNLKTKLIVNAGPAVVQFLSNLNIVAVIFFGVFMIYSGHLSIGALIAVMILSSRAIAPAGNIASLISNYKEAKNAYSQLDLIINKEQERELNTSYLNKNDLQMHIQFENVSFSYPKSNVKALDNVSFTIRKGEKVALVGRVGSGKSTVAKLLLKLYEPCEGKIYIDGIDIAQLDPAQIRKRMGYMPQDIELFEGSIRSNILRQYSHLSDEWMIKCAKIAQIDRFIHTHPKGYNLMIADGGKGLSGGQKQSIALARALIADAPFIILDEPSSSMDHTTQNALLQSLQSHLQDKTLLLNTHKIDMLALTHRVLHFHQGKLVADESYETFTQKLQNG